MFLYMYMYILVVALTGLTLLNKTAYISATVHTMMKSFVPFCLAQDSESADMNCLVF